MKDKILIIDGLNFIYRGLITFGKSKSTVDEGKEEKPDYSVVYNFFRNLRAIIEEFEPSRCFIVLEGDPKFRKELLPSYKANRIVKEGSKKQDSRNNLLRQADIIYDLVSLLPITLVKAKDYEADDAIYALAHNLKDEEVVIVSTDSDLIQILQSLSAHDVKLFHPGKKEFIQPPSYMYLVWKCIAGDKRTDNIPGITSAAKAEELAKNPQELKEFLDKEENRANFQLNKQLIELRLVPNEEIIFTEHKVNFKALFEEFAKMEFATIIKESYREKFIETFENNLL
jgi:5'-3' exonuclease